MRVLLCAIVVLVCAPSLRAQDATLEVLFDRSTSEAEAMTAVAGVLPPISRWVGDGFAPVVVNAQTDAPPSTDEMAALFASGAITVEVTRLAAQLAARGHEEAAEMREERLAGPRYLVRAEFASTMSTEGASGAVAQALGVASASVSKGENMLLVSVPSASLDGVANRVEALAGVVAVRVDR